MPSNTTPYKLPSATVSGLRPFGLRFLLLGIIINLEAQPSRITKLLYWAKPRIITLLGGAIRG